MKDIVIKKNRVTITTYSNNLFSRPKKRRTLKYSSFFIFIFLLFQLFSPVASIVKKSKAFGAGDSWSSTSTVNAPEGRVYHSTVWAGSKMIVWGGMVDNSFSNTGGIYNPSTNSWSNTSTTNAPTARSNHSAVWTGSKMIVWGGYAGDQFNSGGMYDPSNNTWTTTSTTNAPTARVGFSSVWTGSKMIVWGGFNSEGESLDDGGIFDPVNNSWTTISSTNSPVGRHFHTATMVGSKMVVWGGSTDASFFGIIIFYNPILKLFLN